MKPMRVAIVGCGAVSGGHIRAWCNESQRAEIVALADVAPEFAHQRKHEFGLTNATVHADYREALACDDIDAVDICTPSHLHADQIADAMEAGKHVVTEKPTGYTPEECRKLRWHAARHPDIQVAVAYSLRYYPLNLRVRELLQQGVIGRILYGEVSHNHPHDFEHDTAPEPTRAAPRKTPLADKSGHYIPSSEMTGATHPHDLMRYLFGEVRDVFAFRGDCGVMVLMRFQSGAMGKATAASVSNKGIATPHVLCIQGTKGTITTQNEYQYSDKGLVRGYHGTLVTDGKPQPIDVNTHDTSHGDATRTRNFLDAIGRGTPLICSLEDSIRTSELLHAIWDSHNLEIRVPIHRVGKSG